MVPKILGFSAAILATAFILALPSLFEAKPANGVEPITFGADPVLGLAAAEPVDEPARPGRREPLLPEPIPVIIPVIAAAPPTSGAYTTGGQTTQEGTKTVPAWPSGGLSGKGKPPQPEDDEPVREPNPPAPVDDGDEGEDDDGDESGDDDDDGEDDGEDEAVSGTESEGRSVGDDGDEGEDD